MARIHHSRAFTIVLALLINWHSPVLAQSNMDLQITASASESDTLTLSLAELDAMAQVTFTTTTIWTDGDVTFSGVPLKAVLARANKKGSAVEMVALNDYKVAIPMATIEDTVPIIATRMNGEPISVRDKGPYWIVFPYDHDPKYRTETIHAFSIWQLNRLKVVD
ncbi:molybdopterin-dependent oxidoreductase [Tateyamaria armeniaca]|uniref:Molybdopterin-dependent oxidoreductase n=1 Tax=Tateyamaria armeniaca TaxID=2518930 RepID=A0ABW8UWT1_9RHOB